MNPDHPFDHIVNPNFTPPPPTTPEQTVNRTIAALIRKMRERKEANAGPVLMPQVPQLAPTAIANPFIMNNDRQLLGWPGLADGQPLPQPITGLDNPLIRAIRGAQAPDSSLRVDENQIRALLTRDFICRKTRQWPLLTDDQMQTIFEMTLPWLNGKLSDFDYNGIMFVAPRITQSWVNNYTQRHPYTNQDPENWIKMRRATINRLENNYPIITALLEEYHTRLIAAGGAINWHLHHSSKKYNSDIDLFFIDPTIESDTESDISKQERATNLLLDAVSFLMDNWLNRPPVEFEHYEGRRVYVCRGEFVTTVYLTSDEDSDSTKYQFIHRVYPNIGSVLGGFDLGPAMIAFTGRTIVATELGAWSALAKTIIVDTSRRSTSFEHRLAKYADFCHIVFPGLFRDAKPTGPAENLNPLAMKRLIEETMAQHGYCFGKLHHNTPDDDWHYDIVKDEGTDREKVVEVLHEKAAKYGYEISNELRLTKVSESKNVVDSAESMPRDDLKILLVKLAYEYGYQLDIEEMIQDYRETHRKNDRNWHRRPLHHDVNEDLYYLRKREINLKLSKLEISSQINDQHRRSRGGRLWTIRPRIDNKYEVTTDYDGGVVFWPKDGYTSQSHDYGESALWPEYMIAANLTILKNSQDNKASVVSICAFKNSATSLPEGEPTIHPDFKQASITAMQKLFVDVDRVVVTSNRDPKRKIPMTPRQMLKDKLLASIQDPQLGDFESVYQSYNRGSTLFSGEFRREVEDKIEPSRLNLVGVRWIVKNPGTQWTSSINPIVEHPRDWYGPLYRSFRLGDQELETCLRLMRLRRGNPFSAGVMPRDLFRMILIAIFML